MSDIITPRNDADLVVRFDFRYLYYKISSIDANFKLSNRDNTGEDPGLSTGHAYFVPDQEYKGWLKAQGKQTEVSIICFTIYDLKTNGSLHSGIDVHGLRCYQNGEYEEHERFTSHWRWGNSLRSSWIAPSQRIG